jgi:hypothetical protein
LKIYISGSFTEQVRLRAEADKLWHRGHVITSTWLQEVKKPLSLYEDEWDRCLAVKDLAELAAAECIILDVDGKSTTGGRYVEWGFALGRYNMLKIVVGQDTKGVFNTLADKSVDSWDNLMVYLTKR